MYLYIVLDYWFGFVLWCLKPLSIIFQLIIIIIIKFYLKSEFLQTYNISSVELFTDIYKNRQNIL